MFKVKWDAQNNGIILSDNINDEEAIPAPRPVYLQELQILVAFRKDSPSSKNATGHSKLNNYPNSCPD